MPRTLTTVINDLIREVGGPSSISVEWDIPVVRDGWTCSVTINLVHYRERDRNTVHIGVYAHGHLTEGYSKGFCFYTALIGDTLPLRLTRKWIESVLRREIETARAAALSFTEADLHEKTQSPSEDFWQGMDEYFRSSLKG
jgi:hypothetical protein